MAHVRYEDEESFRQAVEKESRVSLTDTEWAHLAEDRYEPFDDLDVAGLVEAVRRFDSQRPKPSSEQKARRHRLAHVERAALEAREMTEEFREKLFGHKQPPYRNQGLEAAEWIESQVRECESGRLSIEVTVPSKLGPMESLLWANEYLAQQLARCSPTTEDNNGHALERFLKESDAIRGLNLSMPMLEYLGVNATGAVSIRRVQAPDGTFLGDLQSKAEQLAKALDWKPYAAVHHLLTGGVVSSAGVQATTRYRLGRQAFGDSHPMKLVMPDPGSVTEEELIASFRKERFEIAPPWAQERPIQRARVTSKSERVAALVAESPETSWDDRLNEWNLRNPEERFRTKSAIKQAYYRARDL